MITGLDHVQLAVPAGSEEVLRAFYGGVLQMAELPKPPLLAARGGCWFGAGAVVLHFGVEQDFRPARKAHPALVVTDWDALAALAARLADLGHEIVWAHDNPGVRRFHTADPVGNRLEFQAG